ncbi:MAG: metal ABC transporter ATP-binding protein [Patescibacteria group bacterium]|jgi:zinc transport system ATP-binding protein|nr:metal ABC transporter ATP-binding protein [Patescibacteria group bacterium]
MATILEVKNLNVKLDNRKIIEDLSFEVSKGDVLTILGPNGAGKTVLLKTLLGIFPYNGKIDWKESVKIGYVPQRLPFIKETPMSVQDFFELKESSIEKIKEALNSVGIKDDFLGKKIGDLSSGQFQRILIAWALLKDPNVLFFDEPTTGIDIVAEETVYNLLERIRKDRDLTIFIITHDLSVVFKFSNYVICLNRSSVCKGVPREVLDQDKLYQLYGEEVKFYVHHND